MEQQKVEGECVCVFVCNHVVVVAVDGVGNNCSAIIHFSLCNDTMLRSVIMHNTRWDTSVQSKTHNSPMYDYQGYYLQY